MPKILVVMWPRSCPFREKLFVRPLGFPKMKLRTKFEVSNSSSFEDMFDRMPKILGVKWLKSCPFWGKLFERPLGFPKASYVPNLKTLALIDFNIFLIVCQKFYGSRDLGHAPFGENYYATSSINDYTTYRHI